ncbi:MAG: diaminopimelate epimerase [Inquilinus sp.]|nr:diaminopimelate epimerase [Inquilinus sp.]
MTVAFRKMHGLGNDFVVIDARSAPLDLSVAAARAIADRRRGVGCDQLIVLEPAANGADAFMRIRNPDGGEAEACGNATRCVASLLMAEHGSDAVAIETVAGVLPCTAADGAITVDMGPARLDWREIPVAEPCDTLHMPVAIGGLADPVGVNIGNPHAVFFVEDAEAVPLTVVGPVLEAHAFFPARANIEFVSPAGADRIRMRVWERGAGNTQACGSGACAAAVAAYRRGLTGRRVEVLLDGGPLIIEWREDGHVLMTGPVATSFTGTLDDALLSARAAD